MTTLPVNPGLQRRLAYGEQIRSRTRRRNNDNDNTRMPFVNRYTLMLDTMQNRYSCKGVCLHLLQDTTVKIAKQSHFCSICQDYTTNGVMSIIRELPCGHIYHINCIDKWLSDNTKCPLCKWEFNEIHV